jgi:hypothetical protein
VSFTSSSRFARRDAAQPAQGQSALQLLSCLAPQKRLLLLSLIHRHVLEFVFHLGRKRTSLCRCEWHRPAFCLRT